MNTKLIHNQSGWRQFRLGAWLLLIAITFSAKGLAAAADGPEVFTRISQIADRVESTKRSIVQVQLTGTVYGVDRLHHSLALKDDTGYLWIETKELPETIVVGSRVYVEGSLTLAKGSAVLGYTPLMETETLNGPTQQAASIYLAAGQHPFVMDYLHFSSETRLDVFYGMSGSPLVLMPNSALSYPDPNEPSRLLPGVRFATYRGPWSVFPDLKRLTPELTGSTNRFQQMIGSRGNNFAIHYTGVLNVEQPGVYEFWVVANDTVRWDITREASARITVIGTTNLDDSVALIPGQSWTSAQEPLWADTEGTVKQVGFSRGQLKLELSSDTGLMQVTIAGGDPSAGAILLNSRVRLTGLARKTTTLHGSKVAGMLLVPTMENVSILQASETVWRKYSVNSISNVVQTSLTNATIARVQGTVVAVKPGKSLTLADPTGQIEVQSGLVGLEDEDSFVDVLGVIEHGRTNTILRCADFQENVRIGDTNKSLPLLTSVEQIRRLDLDEAARRYPVRFRATVTFTWPGGMRAHVQGESEGIYVSCPMTNGLSLHPGDLCEFEGFTAGRGASPDVSFTRCTVLGSGQWPTPERPTWRQLRIGSLDSQWVEVQGVVISIRGTDLTIAMHGGDTIAHIFRTEARDLERLLNASVRVRGTIRSYFGKNRQVQDVIVQVDSPLDITVESPPPANVFDIAALPMTDLLQFDPNAASARLVKTTGQVVHKRGDTLYLMDGSSGLRCLTREKNQLTPGDQVEVVGILENDGFLPVLRQSAVRAVGRKSMPPAQRIAISTLPNNAYESTFVELEARVTDIRTNNADQILELQAGSRTLLAKLNRLLGELPPIPKDSRVRVQGVYAGQGGAGAQRADSPSLELLMNSPTDVTLLERPTWWTLRHSLLVVGVMALVLGGALVWITALRRRVERATRELKKEITEHLRTEKELNEQTVRLQGEIAERKRMQLEVEEIHRQLLDTSRRAGQAEVASSVLHNVGNVLNSVNVSTNVIAGRLRKMRLTNLDKAAQLLRQNIGNLEHFLTTDEKGKQLPDYLASLAQHLAQEQAELIKEITDLDRNVDHIKEIVAMQQTYAKVAHVVEKISSVELVESALKMHADAYQRQAVNVVRDFKDTPDFTVDRHQVLQILVNIFENAKYACDAGSQPEKIVLVRMALSEESRLRIQIADNGMGIAPDVLPRIFSHGFTTRKNGHGFGLHSAALSAKQLGGSLAVHSDGLGKGATFTLELPLQPPSTEASPSLPGHEGAPILVGKEE